MAEIKKQNTTKRIAIYTALEIVAVLLICMLSGAMDWTNMEITFSKFGEWSFYESVIQKFIMYSAALLVGYFFKLEREELTNNEYFAALDTYRILLKSKKDSFVYFVENIFNPKTKKRYIKMKSTQRLMRLDKHAKDSWKLEFNRASRSEEGIESWKWSSPKVEKYAKKRIELTNLSSDSYIEDNWELISIKYPAISPHVFSSGLRKTISPDDEYRITNRTANDLGRTVVNKLILTLLISVIMALFVLDPSTNELLEQVNGWITVIILYVVRVIMIIINFFCGLISGKKMFQDNYILPIDNRSRILKEYINWKKETNEPDSFADTVLENYEKNLALKKELNAAIEKAESNIK